MSPIINLSQVGLIEGIELISHKKQPYFAYLGIPYGQIKRRFEVSEPADPWEGILKCHESKLCGQDNRFIGKSAGDEDSLCLNVFTRDINACCPVTVWIHPGGFQFGGADSNQFRYIDECPVVVSINYRLGVLGFLNTMEGTVPGNMGLKDQVLALKWVQKHIASFGGDPNAITLAGISAGAASINYHMLSPLSEGLFHRAIMISGSSLNPWALQSEPSKLFEKLLDLTNCRRGTTEESVEALRKLPIVELYAAQERIAKYPVEFDLENMHFVPTIESDSSKSPKFISEHPLISMRNGRIVNPTPVLISSVITEGLFFTALLHSKPESMERLDKEWNTIIPNILYFEQFGNKITEISESIRTFYFQDRRIDENSINDLAAAFGDRLITNGVCETALLLLKHVPVYMGVMNHVGSTSLIKSELKVDNLPGVSHADEILYLTSPELGEEDEKFSQNYIKLLTSFVDKGTPLRTWGIEGEWLPLNQNGQNQPLFHEVTLKSIKPIADPFSKRRNFWNSLLEEI